MRQSKAQSNVQIHVYGDAINSTIIGIDGRSNPIRTDDALFKKVLFEYIGIPTLREIASRIDLFVAGSRGEVREFDFARSSALLRLWMAVLQDRYGFAQPSTFMLDAYDEKGRMPEHYDRPDHEDEIHSGAWVKLRNVHLSSFVNRAPGKFFLGGWRFHYGHEPNTQDRFPVSQSMWTWEDYAVRTIGIGDVRFGGLDGYMLLQAGCASGGSTSPTDAGGATLSPLGFPVLVDDLLYRRLKPTLDDYGSALIEELTAQLVPAPKESGLIWAPGVPKTCLIAADRASVSGVANPGRSHSAIWTVAANDDHSNFHYCVWGFEIGQKGYRANIRSAATTIVSAMNKRNLHPVFECDAEQNWFSDNAAFGPDQIKTLAAQVSRQERLKAELSITEIDAGADHMIADTEGPSLDMQSMDRLSRAWRLFQLNEIDSSLTMTEAFLKDHPNYPFALYLKGVNLVYLRRNEEAKSVLRASMDKVDYGLKSRVEYALKLIEKEG